MVFQRAEMRLDREGSNWMPPRKAVLDGLAVYRYEAVDIVDPEEDDGYWTNSEDTLVLRFVRSDVVSILWAVDTLRADEIDYSDEEDDFVVRFWWR